MALLVRQKSQFIVATHSPILMAYPDAYIYSFSPKGIERAEQCRGVRRDRGMTNSPVGDVTDRKSNAAALLARSPDAL